MTELQPTENNTQKKGVVLAPDQMQEFEADLEKGKQLLKATQDRFILQITELGEYFHSQREKWKPKGVWIMYLDQIGVTYVAINQMIRAYEYSIENKGVMLNASISGWAQLNVFLGLSDDLKEKLADEIQGEVLDGKQFKEKVDALQNAGTLNLDEDLECAPDEDVELDGVDLNQEAQELNVLPPEIDNMLKAKITDNLEDLVSDFLATYRKSGHDYLTEAVKPEIKALIYILKAVSELEQKTPNKGRNEASFMKGLIGAALHKLTNYT